MSLFVLVFAIFGGVIWMALGEIRSLNREPLVVRASSGPIKKVPEDRGGLAVLNEGSPLVRSLDGAEESPGLERILPPEQSAPQSAAQALPVDPNNLNGTDRINQLAIGEVEPAGGAIDIAAAERIPPVEALRSNEPNVPVIAAPTAAEEAPVPEPSVASLEPAVERPASRQSAEPVSSPPSASSDPANAEGDYRLQLLASKNINAVRSAWEQFQSRFDPLFNDVAARVVGVDTDSGRFYRLQVGPYSGRDAALSVCEEIKLKGGDCFVVGPLS